MAAEAVFTNVYRRKYGDIAGNDLVGGTVADLELVMFAVGEGGANVPPLPTREDIVATGTGPGDLGNGRLRFDKAVTSVVRTNQSVTIICDLAANEPGLDGQGILVPTDPQLYEIGVYDQDGVMAVYGTYPLKIKTAGVAVQFSVTVNY